jgi:hypothetical protein
LLVQFACASSQSTSLVPWSLKAVSGIERPKSPSVVPPLHIIHLVEAALPGTFTCRFAFPCQHGTANMAGSQLRTHNSLQLACTARAGDPPSQVLPGIAKTTAQSPTKIARWPKGLPHPHPKPVGRAPALPSHYCSGALHARTRGASVSSNHSKQRAAHDRKGGTWMGFQGMVRAKRCRRPRGRVKLPRAQKRV